MFQDSKVVTASIAAQLRTRPLRDPLILAIPGSSVALGTSLAGAMGAEFDVALSRMLRSFDRPNLAIGAVSEAGCVYLFPGADPLWEMSPDYDEFLELERRHQLGEIERLKQRYRAIRPQALVKERSVILVDDGTASQGVLQAALKAIRGQDPHELFVAIPAATTSLQDALRPLCDEVIQVNSGDLSKASMLSSPHLARDLSTSHESAALADA